MRTMLIKFNFKNFKSFKNENCLDMKAASIKEHEYNTITIKDKKYLKVAAIYGANASGKTNVLEAFEFMKEKLMISDDTNMNSSEIDNYYNFSFDEKTRNEPIALEVTFLAENKKIYQYGFEIKNKVIVSEWLYVKKVNKSTPIFDRDENKVKFNKSYKAKINKFDVDSNSLFLSLYRKIEKDNDDFKSVYDWFLNSYYLDLGNPKFENRINHLISSKIINDKEYKKRLVEFIKVFDLGIDDIEVKTRDIKDINNGVLSRIELKAVHKNENGEKTLLPFSLESKGTLKMFYLYNFIMDALEDGSRLFIDELDAKLHPLLTRYIINLFHDKEKNIGNGQLIYTTHDITNLNKETFRRDEIWFTEKDNYGVSELFSLSDYKIDNTKVRNDATYNKDYITGRYGAIPVFEEFNIDTNAKS